jgi:lysyl-tRNA synthetase, class II
LSEEQRGFRIGKIEKLREKNINPYPERFQVNYTLNEASSLPDETSGVKVAGRILAIRGMGKITFVKVQDIEGSIQFFLKKEEIGEERYEFFKEIFDLGDFIGGEGKIFTTKTGEKTLRIESFTFLGKSFRPLPEKFHGIQDIETIYRQRYLDLIMNKETRERFLFRSRFIKALRNFLDDKGFLEVETPILQNKPSGASARPFKTHHNTYDTDVYLRISPELTLKKLVVGGYTNVYEIARNFRNEGISPNHLQDFTMIEAYSAYWNYQDNMNLIQELIKHLIRTLYGTLQITISGKEVDLSKDWPEISFRNLIMKDTGIDIDAYKTAGELLAKIKENNLVLEVEHIEKLGRGNLIDALYKKVSRPNIIEPMFLTKHPIDLSPLARANDEDTTITDRFQLIINGQEIINGYSELVDPVDQKDRLIQQSKLKAQGDEDAMVLDEEYIMAMEHGMPPISGWGMGIDRLIQLLQNRENIRDVVLFPLLRPLVEE